MKDHWRKAARDGDPDAPETHIALEMLREYERPESVAHVWQWFVELHRRRGCDMSGNLIPLDDRMVESWARIRKRAPTPDEVEAIFAVDDAFRLPDAPKHEDTATPEERPRVIQRAWPEKKPNG